MKEMNIFLSNSIDNMVSSIVLLNDLELVHMYYYIIFYSIKVE